MKKHWTLRYLKDRLFNLIYFKLNKEVPWLSKKSNFYFNSILTKKMKGVEFGSGRSTLWIANRCKHLTSIEHDINWFKKIKSKGIPSNLTYLHKTDKEYLEFEKEIDNDSIDFCLIDGLQRDKISNKIISKIKPGGFILIDDIERYLPSKTTFSPSKNCCGNDLWKNFDKHTKNWERKYFSDGVTDQLFIFKPIKP